jgi:hypothetical protein
VEVGSARGAYGFTGIKKDSDLLPTSSRPPPDLLRHLSNDQRKRNYEDAKVPYYPSVNASWWVNTGINT